MRSKASNKARRLANVLPTPNRDATDEASEALDRIVEEATAEESARADRRARHK